MDRRSLLKGLVFATAVGTAELSKLVGARVIAKNDGPLLPCDGRELVRKEHPELFKLIGTNYGAGDGEATFNLPNFGQPIDFLPKDNGEDAVAALPLHSIAVMAIRDMSPSVPMGTVLFVAMKEEDLANLA